MNRYIKDPETETETTVRPNFSSRFDTKVVVNDSR
jgi:hypothetical protein